MSRLSAEIRVRGLQEKMERPEVVADSKELAATWAEVEVAQSEVEKLYSRWDELEAKLEG